MDEHIVGIQERLALSGVDDQSVCTLGELGERGEACAAGTNDARILYDLFYFIQFH
jgi:hypothetical protein